MLQARPHAPAQDRSPLQWTGAVVTTAYLPTKTLHDVVPQVRPQFEALLARAAELGLSPKIRSAGRTCEEQAEQVAGGYSHADFCRSMHVLGHAVDLDLTPNTCESHTKLGAWWESRGGVWGGRWKQFGACGDMGHYHYGFGGAGAVPTATCPSGVTLEQCQKLREEYLDRAYSAGPGVSSRSGLWAGLAIVAAGAAFVWAALSVKPGRLALVRGNPSSMLRIFLGTKSSIPVIGEETGRDVANGISRYVSEHGSYRYLYREQGTPKAVLQLVSHDRGPYPKEFGKVANVYVVPEARRRGLATMLLRRAKEDFDEIEHADAEDRSEDADAWIRGRGNATRGNPRFKYDAWQAVVYLPGGQRETWGPATFAAASEVAERFRFQTRERCPPHGCDTSVQRVAGKPKYELVNGEPRKIRRAA